MGRIKRKKKSLFLSLLLYFAVGLLTSQMLYYGASNYVNDCMLDLMDPRPIYMSYQNNMQIVLYDDEEKYSALPTIRNQNLFDTLIMVNKVLPFFLFGFGILITAYIFYTRKLKHRFSLLKKSIEEIGKNNLDFSMECKGNDEITMLCISFEIMRKELKKTFENLWMEEEKQRNLYRAFAHDLRTPLTVIKGSTDLFRYLVEKDELIKEEVLETLDTSTEALKRIELYTDALKEMKDLEQWEFDVKEIEVRQIAQLIKKQYTSFAKKRGKKLIVWCNCNGICKVDMTWLQLIIDKVIENAIRFAKDTITTQINEEDGKLYIEIMDDGVGFTQEAIKKATDMFYSTDKTRGHSGIGLAVAEKLLSRMGRRIEIKNLEKGAKVSFCIENV